MQPWVRNLAVSLFGILSMGCYSLLPLEGVGPEVGARVAFDVTDAGRVALGGSMGPEISQIEGLLVERDSNGDFLVSVNTVRLLRGGEQVWSGERVLLNPAHVGRTYERRFSWSRTLVLGAVGVGGVTAFMVTRSLIASGQDDDPPVNCDLEPPPPGCSAQDRKGRP